MCKALVEHHKLRWATHEFALPERDVKDRERKVSSAPLGLQPQPQPRTQTLCL